MSAPDLRRIVDVARLLKTGALAPQDLVLECLEQIEARPQVNAFITLLKESALEEAKRAGTEIGAGRWRGPLHGIPVAVKELIDVAGTRTTSGSALPSTEAVEDAPIVTRLREAGAIILGKTNMTELAYGGSSVSSLGGQVLNPYDLTRTPGGSSGGTGAAIAASYAVLGTGSDTGQSIRSPASACGLVGLRPTRGLISRRGLVPFSPTPVFMYGSTLWYQVQPDCILLVDQGKVSS